MRDLTGRVERLERKVVASEDEVIVLELPYSDQSAEAEQRLLEQRGLTPSDIGGRTAVFLTSYAA